MLGPHAGSFRIAPVDVEVPADLRYLPGTMIMETSWGTGTGWIIVRDALLMGPWRHEETAPRPIAARPTTTTPSTSCCAPSAACPARCSW